MTSIVRTFGVATNGLPLHRIYYYKRSTSTKDLIDRRSNVTNVGSGGGDFLLATLAINNITLLQDLIQLI